MRLLNCPPDIFQHIIEDLVQMTGVVEVQIYRNVNGTFDEAIVREVFGKTDLAMFDTIEEQRVLKDNMEVFLRYKLENLCGVHAFLPTTIRNAVDMMLLHSQTPAEGQRAEYEHALCKAAVGRPPGHCRRWPGERWQQSCFELLEKGAMTRDGVEDRTLPDSENLAACIVIGHVPTLNHLLDNMIDPAHASRCFGEPLQLAVKYGHLEVLDLLLKATYQASIREANKNGINSSSYRETYVGPFYSAISAAVRSCNLGMLRILLKWNAKTRLNTAKADYNQWMRSAIDRGENLDIMRALMSVKVTGGPKVPADVFLLACTNGHAELVGHFLQNGNVNLMKTKVKGALCSAAGGGHLSIVNLLLDAGASPNEMDWYTPLGAAAWNGHLDVLRRLLDAGADPNLPFCGRSARIPLTCAIANGHGEIAHLLRMRGAKEEEATTTLA